MKTPKNIFWHPSKVSKKNRESQNGHKGLVVWFTGLSGSGKSTLAHTLEDALYKIGCRTFVLDGDNIRHGLCRDLGFSDQDRSENIRRVGEVSKLFADAGIIVLAAFISPFADDRKFIRSLVEEDAFLEIYCDSPIEVCEARDVKGLYKKARLAEIENFTGLSSIYETPIIPDLVLHTSVDSVNDCVKILINKLYEIGAIDFLKLPLPNQDDC